MPHVLFHSDSFASTGQDKKLRIWTLPKDPESDNVRWKVDLNYDYYSVPHNLAFRPGSEILAVAEKYGLFFSPAYLKLLGPSSPDRCFSMTSRTTPSGNIDSKCTTGCRHTSLDPWHGAVD